MDLKKKRGILFILFLSLCLSAFSTAADNSIYANDESPDEDKITIRFGISVLPELDPGVYLDDPSTTIVTHLFRGLTQLDENGEVIPDLAESWSASEDLQTWTFSLKEDLYWVDNEGQKTQTLTAQDAVFAWKRSFESDITPMWDQSIIQDCTAPDDLTIVYQLNQPYGGFPYFLASPGSFPVPESLIQTNGEYWCSVDLIWTSGPYYLQSFVPAEGLVMERNPHWPGTYDIQIDRIEMTFADDQTLVMAYRQNDLDVIWLDDSSVITSIGDDPELSNQVFTTPSKQVFGYVFSSYLLGENAQIRQAISLTIDRDAICTSVLGYSNPIGTLIPSGAFGHSAIPIQLFDPVLAENQLEEIGYKRDSQIPLSFGYIGLQSVDLINEQVIFYWEDFGFDLIVSELTREEMIDKNYLQETEEQPDDIIMWEFTVNHPDPVYYFWNNFYGGQHLTGWQNSDFDDLITSAMTTASDDERASYLREAEKILLWEDPLFISVCGESHVFLAKPNISLAGALSTAIDFTDSLIKEVAYKESIEKKTGVTLKNGDKDWTIREVKIFNDVYYLYKNNLNKNLLTNLEKLKTIVRKKADGSTFGVFTTNTNEITIYDQANSTYDFTKSDDQFKGTLAHEILHLLVTYNTTDGSKYVNRYESPLLKGYIDAINKALDKATTTKKKYGWYQKLGAWKFTLPDKMTDADKKKYSPPTDYGKNKNPEEDLAESIMFYLIDPEKLDATRYNYIKDNIFNGKEFK